MRSRSNGSRRLGARPRAAVLLDQFAEDTRQPSGAVDVDSVVAALDALGYEPVIVAFAGDATAWLAALVDGDFRLAFNLCEGLADHAAAEHLAAAAVELLGIPLTGAPALTLGLCLRKDLTGALLRGHGVAVPDWVVARSGAPPPWRRFPAIVKPVAEDASIGIGPDAVVHSRAELEVALARRAGTWDRLLVQRFVPGREFNLAVVGGRVLPHAEIDFSALPVGWPAVVTYAAKWEVGSVEDRGTVPRCPARVSDGLGARLTQLARRVWAAVGGAGYGRIDVRVDRCGQPFVLDVNPNPDLSPGAGFARQAAAAGWSYPDLIARIVKDALARMDPLAAARRGPVASRCRPDPDRVPVPAAGSPPAASWQRTLQQSVRTVDQLVERFGARNIDPSAVQTAIDRFNLGIAPEPLRLIQAPDDPFWLQYVPTAAENTVVDGQEDPLAEDADSPVPNITHRYPDRVLFLVSPVCATYCRFCTRRRKVGDPEKIPLDRFDAAFAYIRAHPEVRDVILSGGDPFMLSDRRVEYVLKHLRAIRHVEILRIHTRIPSHLPERITPELCEVVRKYHPVYVNVHVNHPDELTPAVRAALGRLADAGCPLGCQTVLLRGVNDDPAIMRTLVQELLRCRVRPYYLYQADLVAGAEHFRTSVEKGLEIIEALRGWTSGLAVPHFVIDAPGGGGKIPLLPNYVHEVTDAEIVLRNYAGKVYRYPHPKAGLPPSVT